MRKSVLYFYTLICSMCILTTSCSKDDNGKQTEEGGSWEELPNGDIPADNVELNLNGASTTGTISFKALSAETAQIGLKNVIDGYSDVTVDLAMTEQTDGSYKLNGTKEINTKPITKAANTSAALLTVTVDGTITVDGKVTAKIKAEGPGLYIGTYTGSNLVLKYGEDELTGKTVVFDATDGNNVSLQLNNIIPGDVEATISNIQVKEGVFTGTVEATTANIKYTGSLENKVLTLDLDVTMKDPGKWIGAYDLSKYTLENNKVTSSPLYFNWEPDGRYSKDAIPIYKALGAMLLPQVLNSVTFEADGNIIASYSKRALQIDMNTLQYVMFGMYPTTEDVEKLIPTEGWIASPKHLAYWYNKDNKLYVKLNIAAIVSQAMGADASGLQEIISTILQSDVATIKGLLGKLLKIDVSSISDETFEMLLDWIKNGIPLSVNNSNGCMNVYLDKTAFDSIMTDKETPTNDNNYGEKADLIKLWGILSASGIIPEDAKIAALLFSNIPGAWPQTTAFDLGLSLQTK